MNPTNDTAPNPPSQPARSAGPWLGWLIALSTLAACGGGGGGGTPADPPVAAPPPPPANRAPAAAFSAPAAAVAGNAVLFDARATTDADGDPLTFSWDFGNGVRGGGDRIGHVFDRAGDYTVRLTVSDGRGGLHQVQRTLNVAAGAAPAGFVDSRVSVRSERGLPLAGVSVALADGSASTTTAADGQALLRTGTGVPLVLRLSKDGYADQVQRLQVPASSEPGFVQVTLRERAAAVLLPDAAAGGTVAGPDGVRVVFAPGSLVDASGNPATGAVQVAMTPVDVTESPRAFPGRFEGLAGDGREGLIVSFGVVEVVLRQAGQPLQLAPGRSATLEIPVYARQGLNGQPLQPGDTYPMWSLNERTGLWVAEATGTVVAAPGTPEGLALRGEVTHFSWWNHDLFTSPPYRPRPKCLVDSNYDGVLEDLSGTGYCWHEAGTQTNWEPRLRQFGAVPDDRRRALQARIANDPPPTPPRQPAFIATGATPAGGGAELLIPPDMDIIFHSYARNGTLFGQTRVRGASGVSEDVVMVLSPVQDATGTLPVTLPWNRVYAMSHVGEVDRFSLVATAGQTLELQFSRSNASTLGTDIVVRAPGGNTVASGAMGVSGRTFVIPDAVAGTYTVEVQASGSAPGAYRLQARALAGTCSAGSAAPLALPLDQTVALPRDGLVCLDVDLAAGQALAFEARGASSGLRGSVQLRSPTGEAVAQDSFVTGGRTAVLRLGVVQPGTYRVEVVNSGTASGNVRLVGDRETLPEMALPDTFSRSDIASGGATRVLLRPPVPGNEFALAFDGCNGTYSVTVFPSRVNFTATGGNCGGTAFLRGMSYQEHPAVLPVVQVVRNISTATGPAGFTLRSQGTAPLPLDTDVTVTALPRGTGLRVHTFTGEVGQALSWGVEEPAGTGQRPTVRIYGPDGVAVSASFGTVWSLAANGRHTVVVLSDSSFSGDFTLRLNNAAPPVELTLQGARTEINGTLALGEVRRWRFALDNAELFALGLSTPNMVGLSATAGSSLSGATSVSAVSGTPFSAQGAPVYAAGSAVRELRLGSAESSPGRTRGEFSLAVLRPLPLPADLAQAISGTLAPRELRAWHLNLPAAGYHLLRTEFPNNNGEPFRGVVWGPTAPFTFYDGDLWSGASEGASEAIASLRAGVHTLSLERTAPPSFAIPGGAQAAFRAWLVPLPLPEAITLGAAAQARSLLTPGERRYHRFDAVQGQGYTVKVQAAFAGTVRVYRLSGSNHTSVGTNLLPGFPVALTAGTLRTASFTIPGTLPSGAVFGSGVYVIEVDAAGDATGGYTVEIGTP